MRRGRRNSIQARLVPVIAGGINYQPFSDAFGTDGALGSDWTGSTWTVASGAVTNTPTLGAELASNVEFTTDTTGWTAAVGATLTRRDYTAAPDIDPTGGTDEYGMEVASGGDITSAANQNVGVTTGNFYRLGARAYSPSGNTQANAAAIAGAQIYQFSGYYRTASEDSWQTLVAAGRSTGATLVAGLRCASTTAGDLAHYDAVSVKQITAAEVFATVGNCSPNIDISVEVTRPSTTRAAGGLVLCMDSAVAPLNYILVYLNSNVTNAVTIDKCLNGTFSNVANISITYSAGAALRVVKSGTSVSVYYNGAQIGTTQTVSDVTIINNTRHGMFSTDPTVSLDDFSVDKKKAG